MKFKDVEDAHQEYKQKIVKYTWISVPIMAVIALFLAFSNGGGSSLSSLIIIVSVLIFLSALALIIILFSTRKYAQKYHNAYKAYFVEKNLANTFSNLEYSHTAGLDKNVLKATQMINTGDVYSSNDLTTGKYKDVAFTQADVHIQEVYTDSDGNTNYVTIFKGRFMIFEFPKKFNFRLEVVEKGFGASKVPGKNPKTGRKFEKIKVESGEFNDLFKTYAEDGFEAFYILDPAFINNILELDTQYNGKLFLGFLDNKLIVGLKDGKDAFEPPSVFKKLDEATETEKIAKDIRLITNFVDKLKLDRKLFKKPIKE